MGGQVAGYELRMLQYGQVEGNGVGNAGQLKFPQRHQYAGAGLFASRPVVISLATMESKEPGWPGYWPKTLLTADFLVPE